MTKNCIIALLCLLLVLPTELYSQSYPYQDANLPREQRVEDLLSRLSLSEKFGLMMYDSQEVERLSIPKYNWWNEALHGVARAGLATVFPQAIGMAATFNPEMQLETFTIVSDEARAKYNDAISKGIYSRYRGLSFWTPNINIFRDPRWGRGQETYGEDPYLSSVMGAATVRGLQGDDPNFYKTHACAKHFAVHSGPEWNRHSFDVTVSGTDLWETYLPAFKALVDADVREVMGAYNRYNGDPCCASDFLLKDILRGKWGYTGMVVSDCWAVNDFFMPNAHNVYPNRASASAAAVLSGIDVECGDAFKAIVEAVLNNQISETEIDVNIRRILNGMFELGFFDKNLPWDNIPYSIVDCQKHKNQALKVSRESMVLLKNKDNLLPIKPSRVKKIAIIGPNAKDKPMLLGNYNGSPSSIVTIYDGIKAAYTNAEIYYERGCDLVEGSIYQDPIALANMEMENYLGLSPEEIESIRNQKIEEYSSMQPIPSSNYTPEALKQLASRVSDADVIFFVGGLSPQLEGEEMRVKIDGFNGGDREKIELPEVQGKVLKALHDTGVPVVFVLCSGSAVALEQNEADYDALLCAWYGGQAGGTAVGDILSGKVSPSGKLPITFYKSTAQLPDFQNYDMSGRTYRYMSESPLYPFAYGLSYANFVFGKAKLSSNKIKVGQSVKVSVKLSNKSDIAASEVVQVYVKRLNDPKAPIKSLKAFKKVKLEPNQKTVVDLVLEPSAFEYYDESVDGLVIKTGKYEILYGNSSADNDLQKLRLEIK